MVLVRERGREREREREREEKANILERPCRDFGPSEEDASPNDYNQRDYEEIQLTKLHYGERSGERDRGGGGEGEREGWC